MKYIVKILLVLLLTLYCGSTFKKNTPSFRLIDYTTKEVLENYPFIDSLRISKYEDSRGILINLIASKNHYGFGNYFFHLSFPTCFPSNDVATWVGQKKVFGGLYSDFTSDYHRNETNISIGFQNNTYKDIDTFEITSYNKRKNLASGYVEMDICDLGNRITDIGSQYPPHTKQIDDMLKHSPNYSCLFLFVRKQVCSHEQVNRRRIRVEFENLKVIEWSGRR